MLSLSAATQTVLFEEDFNYSDIIPPYWTSIDGDGLTPAASVSNFTSAWIGVYIPAGLSEDTCVASTSYYNPAGQSADYLISPKLSLPTYSKLVWSARSYDASYPDSYVVLISTTDSLAAAFTDTLMMVVDETYYWNKRSVQLDLEGYANQDVYIAIKNITYDGYILYVDKVKLLGSDNLFVSEESNSVYSVYPNPCQDQITISNFKPGDLVNIYSMDGKLLASSNEPVVNVSSLNAGTYLIKIVSEEGIYTAPFIKQ